MREKVIVLHVEGNSQDTQCINELVYESGFLFKATCIAMCQIKHANKHRISYSVQSMTWGWNLQSMWQVKWSASDADGLLTEKKVCGIRS